MRGSGGVDNLINWSLKSDRILLMKYTDDQRAKEDYIFEDPSLMCTPIVRNGKEITVGYCPDIWEKWE